MARVFTITEGLENMGALKTGGQGSVYKGRRIGEIITAVKLLPTPIHTENATDKNYIDFQNEVEKLKKVNEVPNPNVVKILSSGFSESGSFPFIEMEFIEGPDLEELLKPPHDAVFTIKETIKIAEQLSGALAHCHKVNVKHGDIKSNNVKFNINTGNYVLLDFGLAIMSDEQRRTSLRQAGAIEFMAPEQNEGQMLFETDVYSFGVILFEILAGTVPFPQKDKGETARNLVRLAHMETSPPDLLSLRKDALPPSWPATKKEHEMQVPGWLVDMVYKCLEKEPAARFKDGVALHDYIVLNSTLAVKKTEHNAEQYGALLEEKNKLVQEKEALQRKIVQYQNAANEKEAQYITVQRALAQKESEPVTFKNTSPANNPQPGGDKGVSKSAFFALLLLTAGISAFAAYALFFKTPNKDKDTITSRYETPIDPTTSKSNNIGEDEGRENEMIKDTPKAIMPQPRLSESNEDSIRNDREQAANEQSKVEDTVVRTKDSLPPLKEPEEEGNFGQYRVIASKAHFHNEPDESTRRKAFINPWNNATLTALAEENDFIYIIFTNAQGQTSKGWLRKKDLKLISE